MDIIYTVMVVCDSVDIWVVYDCIVMVYNGAVPVDVEYAYTCILYKYYNVTAQIDSV
jgi:hypothetical protein